MGDWLVACSDDEKSEIGSYEPSEPSIIIHLYEALKEKELPQFETIIYPRKETNLTKDTFPITKETESMKTPEEDSAELTEFDFDTQPEDDVKRFTPRRTPNRAHTKKVAMLSNVFSDIMKYSKLDKEQGKNETEGLSSAQVAKN